MSSVFLVRIHVWLKMAMLDVVTRDGLARGREGRNRMRWNGAPECCVDIKDYETKATIMLQDPRMFGRKGE